MIAFSLLMNKISTKLVHPVRNFEITKKTKYRQIKKLILLSFSSRLKYVYTYYVYLHFVQEREVLHVLRRAVPGHHLQHHDEEEDPLLHRQHHHPLHGDLIPHRPHVLLTFGQRRKGLSSYF